ncbi:MAG TPA: hypothetical protein VFK02_04665, partial [Kofleriaceae bacterium]|nr:hypothetical protein [Kofleriaceae bacterium]
MRVLLAFVLVACTSAGRGPAGPAWPKQAAREADGGESLAPRAAARAIAAIVEDDRAAERAEKPAAATPAAASTGSDKPATAT